MHLEGAGIGANEACTEPEPVMTVPAKRSAAIGASLADDKELEAIFVRTYGEIKQRKPEVKRTIRASEENTVSVPSKTRKEENQEHYLLVDGYNILFAWDELNELSKYSMDAARNKLMDILSNYQGYTAMHIILVFDAYKVEGFQGEVTKWHNIDVVFTKEAETADQYIEKTAHVIGRKYKVTVATSDGVEQVIIRSKGCLLLSARELREEIQRVSEEIRTEHLNGGKSKGNYLLDYLSPEESARMEAIRLGLLPDDK
jgi:predicted RNA-binding protein with PIN domain